MVLIIIFVEVFGVFMFYLKFVDFVVYIVLSGIFSLLFGFFVLNGDWCYFLVIVIILVVGFFIYCLFVKIVFVKEE